jgi:hypothetical protein
MAPVRRRSVILGAAAATGAGLLLFLQPALRRTRFVDSVLRKVSGAPGLRTPELTGEAPEAVVRQLWLLFTRLADRWQMRVDLGETGFRQFIREKTTLPPSYLTEYRQAAAVLEEVELAMESDPSAFDQLFVVPLELPGFGATRLARLQQFVIGEFLELQLAFGGFRAFGYRNYRGFTGGPLSDPARPPYRSR